MHENTDTPPKRTEMSNSLLTTRSGRESLLRSSATIETGRWPTRLLTPFEKLPSPFPRRIEMVTARSCTPSPFPS